MRRLRPSLAGDGPVEEVSVRVLKIVLRSLWTAWKWFWHAVGTVSRFVILTLFYFLLVNLVHVVLCLLRVDLLDRRLQPVPTYWRPKPPPTEDLYRHQF